MRDSCQRVTIMALFTGILVQECWAEKPIILKILGSRLGLVVELADERRLVGNRSRPRCNRSR